MSDDARYSMQAGSSGGVGGQIWTPRGRTALEQAGYNIESPPGVCREGMLIACQPDRVTSSLLEPSRSYKENKRAGWILGYICSYRFTNARPYVYSSHLKCCKRINKANGCHWGQHPVAATRQREAIAAYRAPVCTHDSKVAKLLRQSAINQWGQRVKIEDS